MGRPIIDINCKHWLALATLFVRDTEVVAVAMARHPTEMKLVIGIRLVILLKSIVCRNDVCGDSKVVVGKMLVPKTMTLKLMSVLP